MENSEYVPYPQFLLLGDSLIQFSSNIQDGYSLISALQGRYPVRDIDIRQRGFSGYNTSHALKALPKIIHPPSHGRIQYLLVLLGANDACLPGISTGQGVPLEQYKKNLETILGHPLIAAHDPRILVAIPPPVDAFRCREADLKKGVDEVRREADRTASFAQGAREVAATFGEKIAVVDLWKAFMDEAIRSTPTHDPNGPMLGSRELGGNKALIDLVQDGLHMSRKGYELFFKTLVDTLETKWPVDGPQTFPPVLPPWPTAPKLA